MDGITLGMVKETVEACLRLDLLILGTKVHVCTGCMGEGGVARGGTGS